MQQFAVLGTGTSEGGTGTIKAGLSTQTSNAGPDDGSGITPGTQEPSSTGSYARQPINWATPATGSLDATVPALNSGSISWTSTAAFSTGATTLQIVTLWNTTTLATVTEAAFLGRANIAVPQAVNASGITLTIAASGLSMGFISA
jgi:hypothetical protein